MSTFGTIAIPTPHVPYGPVGIPAHLSDSRYLREAAKHIEEGYPVGGSNLTEAVLKLLRDAADAIEATNQQSRSALPADQDARFAEAVAKITPCTCSAQRARAERAEAEVARLNAQLGDCICNLGPGTEGPSEADGPPERWLPADDPDAVFARYRRETVASQQIKDKALAARLAKSSDPWDQVLGAVKASSVDPAPNQGHR